MVDMARKRALKAMSVRDHDVAANAQPLRRMQTARILAMNHVSPSVREGILGPDVFRALQDLNLEKTPVGYEKLDRQSKATVMAARSQVFLETWS